jgi:hypothetical protein
MIANGEPVASENFSDLLAQLRKDTMQKIRGAKKAAITLGMSAVAVITSLAVAAPAYASKDVGWQYSPDAGARGYFDADVAGWAGAEEITACDNKTDGYAAIVFLYDANYKRLASVRDTYNDGSCTSTAFNMITDERNVIFTVCTDTGDQILTRCSEQWGVS